MAIKQVDVSGKAVQRREAVAVGRIILKRETVERIKRGMVEKGDPIQLARVGGVIGAKMTPSLLPLCHQLKLEAVEILENLGPDFVEVRSRVVASEKTGVEMEALVAVTTALLNIWDAVKQYEKDAEGQYPSTMITDVKVISKVKRDEAP